LEHSTGRILTQYNNTGFNDLFGPFDFSGTIGIQQGGVNGSSPQWNGGGNNVPYCGTILFTPPSAVPEPSTYALMRASLVVLSVPGRSRRRKL